MSERTVRNRWRKEAELWRMQLVRIWARLDEQPSPTEQDLELQLFCIALDHVLEAHRALAQFSGGSMDDAKASLIAIEAARERFAAALGAPVDRLSTSPAWWDHLHSDAESVLALAVAAGFEPSWVVAVVGHLVAKAVSD